MTQKHHPAALPNVTVFLFFVFFLIFLLEPRFLVERYKINATIKITLNQHYEKSVHNFRAVLINLPSISPHRSVGEYPL